MQRQITEKQQEILDFIIDYINTNSYPPTKKEIAAHFKKHKSGMFAYLIALQKKGFIKLLPHVARGIQVINGKSGFPVINEVSAGTGVEFCNEVKERWSLPKNEDLPKETIIFKVRGNSMVDAGILDGDTIMVDPVTPIRSNDIVVYRVENHILVKHVIIEENKTILQSANSNSNLPDIIIDEHTSANIIGTVIAVWRQVKKTIKQH